jgi:aspartate kinase
LPTNIKVLKFGGTSLEDWPAFERAAQIVGANADGGLVVIVSAMSGVTDALIKSFRKGATGETAAGLQLLEEHFERHLTVAKNLGAASFVATEALIEYTRREISGLVGIAANDAAPLQTQDRIASYGEFLSAKLLTLVLGQYGVPATCVDARQCIVTNDAHGNASPLREGVSTRTKTQLEPLIERRSVPVLGGFIGATLDGITTTLGRGSSDYSATLIGAALDACEIQIWTDVDGVQTANPGLVKSARTVPKISYEEAAQLARFGARLMHPKMIEPIVEQQIPIRIRNSRAPEQLGTLINAKGESNGKVIKAIAYRSNLATINIRSTPAFVANGFGHAISEVFAQHKTELDIVARSPAGMTVAYEEDAMLPAIVQDLARLGSVSVSRERAVIGCVGDGLTNGVSNDTDMVAKLRQIDPSLDWQGISNNNLIAIVAEDHVGSIVGRLHQGIFE